MFGALRKAVALRGIRSSFDSAFQQAIGLPLSQQKLIATNLKKKMLQVTSSDPFIYEQKLIALNHEAKFARQLIVSSGLATAQSDPNWLEPALLESFALAGISKDEALQDHVMTSISSWIKRLSV